MEALQDGQKRTVELWNVVQDDRLCLLGPALMVETMGFVNPRVRVTACATQRLIKLSLIIIVPLPSFIII